MASCEKCWNDAFSRSMMSSKDQFECYSDLIKERKNNPCTPEEQAGHDAKTCTDCNRKTIHQYAHYCVNPDCEAYYKILEEK
jgi:hypothetical protein